ncbi:MAG: helix-turn-helix transcriptional regulator [Vulcanimicrobiota bacterium]|nr:helix-turn-helix transcriptional regulator [Candidatus Eremiobacteraeota bacterium]
MNFPSRLRKARKEARLSQLELGRRLGVSGQSVKEWEAGRSSPQFDRLKEIATVTGKPVAWFFLSESEPGGFARTVQVLHETMVELERVSAQVERMRARLTPVVGSLNGETPRPWSSQMEWAHEMLSNLRGELDEIEYQRLVDMAAKARWSTQVG